MKSHKKMTGFELIEDKASDIIQKTAEVEGALKTIDMYSEEANGIIPDYVLWAIRHAYRTVASATEDAGVIVDTAEEMQRRKPEIQAILDHVERSTNVQ